jgi:hypothetical protein
MFFPPNNYIQHPKHCQKAHGYHEFLEHPKNVSFVCYNLRASTRQNIKATLLDQTCSRVRKTKSQPHPASEPKQRAL